MPVVIHQHQPRIRVGKRRLASISSYWNARASARLVKDRLPLIPPIEHVIDQTTWTSPNYPRHARMLIDGRTVPANRRTIVINRGYLPQWSDYLDEWADYPR